MISLAGGLRFLRPVARDDRLGAGNGCIDALDNDGALDVANAARMLSMLVALMPKSQARAKGRFSWSGILWTP